MTTNKPTPADDSAPSDDDEHAGLARHLDTSFLINALVPGTREDDRLRQWIRQGLAVSMSSIGWAEFLCGPVSEEDRQRARKVVGAPLPLIEMEAAKAAELFNAGGRKRGTLPDCLIAATALLAGAALATSNSGDFQRFERAGLKLVAG
jgi:predicted nucleic acid-binding protein